jgi:O-antigen/teichoic acid export membrane protein
MLLLGPLAFRIIFGPQWADAGVMVRWLALALVCQLVAIPLAQTLNVLGYQRQQLAWDVTRLTLTVAGFVWAHYMALSAVASVAVYGVITAVTYLLLIALSWRAIRERAAAGSTTLTTVAGTPP